MRIIGFQQKAKKAQVVKKIITCWKQQTSPLGDAKLTK